MRDSNPHSRFIEMPVFETGALPVQPTLHNLESSLVLSDEPLLINHLLPFTLPRVGFEPTHKRFLRPPPLPLGYRGATIKMHRAGLEPTFIRLKGGGSAIELPVRTVHMHREGFEPPAIPLEEGRSVPLSYRCKN